MTHLGATDSELRDDLIYTALAYWLLRHRLLTSAQRSWLLTTVLDDEHLFAGIGEHDTDSVFTRTFSVLLLPLLLIAERHDPQWDTAEFTRIKMALLRYLTEERDLRGYVPGKGWAHGMAHAADALDDLAQAEALQSADLVDLLGAIQRVVSVGHVAYAHLEEERLVTAVLAILKREAVASDVWSDWSERFATDVNAIGFQPGDYTRVNVKSFLQSLSFRLRWHDPLHPLLSAIDQALQAINLFK
jgi:hypothetical protein